MTPAGAFGSTGGGVGSAGATTVVVVSASDVDVDVAGEGAARSRVERLVLVACVLSGPGDVTVDGTADATVGGCVVEVVAVPAVIRSGIS